MRQSFRLCLLPLCIFLLPLAAQGQGTDNAADKTIQGIVRASGTQQTLERARVDLVTPDEQLIVTTFTDSNGRFEFRSLVRGIYRIKMSADDYETLEKTVDLRYGPGSVVDYSLDPVKKVEEAAPGGTISAHELSMPSGARDAVQAGKEKLYGKKDPQGSLADFERAIAAAPGYYEAYYEMGVAHWQLGNLPEAEQDLRRSSEMSDGRYAKTELALGALFLDHGQFAEAEKRFRHAAALEPNNWLTQYELAKALLALHRFDEALQAVGIARLEKGDSPPIFMLLATIHHALKNETAAIDDLNHYLELDPDSPAALRAKKMKEDIERSLAQGQAATTGQTSVKP